LSGYRIRELAMEQRPAVFISHANPEDNEFTIWLGSHLSAAGYEVWADVLTLRGGEDWARKLEKALRERAFKVLLVGTPWGVEKQGVRNEIQIATEVAKRLGDDAFVIPLRLQQYDSPFQIVQAQYIDFMNGWGQGLSELLQTLDGYKVPRLPSSNTESVNNWRGAQLAKARVVQHAPEALISNWLRVSEWPNSIGYFEFQGAGSEERVKGLIENCRWPVAPFGRGFFSCADKADFRSEDGTLLPTSLEKEWWLPHFLENGDQDRSIDRREARRIVTQLTKCALENKFRDSNLAKYEFSAGVTGWWVPSGLITDDKVSFKWDKGPSGRRNLVGEAAVGASKYKWHFGASGRPWVSGNPHVRIVSRVIFSTDGITALDDVKYMHRLRRSVPKSWRNARWRDMLLAFLFWLSKGERYVCLKMGSVSVIKLEVPPISMICPVSVSQEDTEVSEDVDREADDPVFAVGFDEDNAGDAESDLLHEDGVRPQAGEG
jgi:hypothetical protein